MELSNIPKVRVVKRSHGGIEYLFGLLKEKAKVVTRVSFWRIPHTTEKEDVCLKIGRYHKSEEAFVPDTLYCSNPKSELTLDNQELQTLLSFVSDNYEPFKQGVRRYIPIDEKFDQTSIEHLKAIFNNPDKKKVLDFIEENNILSEELLISLQNQSRFEAIQEFEKMLKEDLIEQRWQEWLSKNDWVLGTDCVKILDEREIDTANITDYLIQAYDGFLDIVEIKRPDGSLKFWADTLDHENYVPSSDLTKAITQATKYIYEVEREANSVKFLERVGNIKTIKPRCVLIFGRSNNWNQEQKESFRILNSSYHNLSIMTYDHVLRRAKRLVGIIEKDTPDLYSGMEDVDPKDIPF